MITNGLVWTGSYTPRREGGGEGGGGISKKETGMLAVSHRGV